jgi:predicted nucleic acid-binding protein
MTYLVDSNWIILALHDDPQAVAFLERLISDGVAMSIITYMEVLQGLEREIDPPAAIAQFQRLLDQVPVLPFSMDVARCRAVVREILRLQKRRVNSRALDLLNAATALEYNLIFVTQNIDDYKDLPEAVGLQLYQPPAPPAEPAPPLSPEVPEQPGEVDQQEKE